MPNAFQYGWMGSTQRLLQVSKGLATLGYDVVLIASAYSNRTVQAAIDPEFPGTVIRTAHYGAYPSLIDGLPSMRRVWRGLWRLQGDAKYWINVSEGWATRIDSSVINDFLCRAGGKKPQLVWGISAGLLEGGSAAERIAQYFECPWVYELHDPPLHAGLQETIDSVDTRFRELLESAALIVPNSGTYERSLHAVHGVPQSKLQTIFLTFAGRLENRVSCSRDKVVMGHFGSMNGARSALPMLETFVRLAEHDPSLATRFELIFAGEGKGIDEAISFMGRHGMGHVVRYVGMVPKNEVADLMDQCNVLLIIQPDESHLEIPGKLFETMRQLKPIIGVMSRHSETADILVRSGLGLICESGSDSRFESEFALLLKSTAEESCKAANLDYIASFSSEYLPNHLSNALDAAMDIQ